MPGLVRSGAQIREAKTNLHTLPDRVLASWLVSDHNPLKRGIRDTIHKFLRRLPAVHTAETRAAQVGCVANWCFFGNAAQEEGAGGHRLRALRPQPRKLKDGRRRPAKRGEKLAV